MYTLCLQNLFWYRQYSVDSFKEATKLTKNWTNMFSLAHTFCYGVYWVPWSCSADKKTQCWDAYRIRVGACLKDPNMGEGTCSYNVQWHSSCPNPIIQSAPTYWNSNPCQLLITCKMVNSEASQHETGVQRTSLEGLGSSSGRYPCSACLSGCGWWRCRCGWSSWHSIFWRFDY